jgi:hypothetical protein
MRQLTAVLIVLIGTTLLFPAGACSQPHERFAMQGVLEIGGTLSFQQITPVSNGKTGSSWSYMNLAPSFGIFVIDGLEVGVNPIGVSTISGSGSTLTTLNFMGFVSYNVSTPPGMIFPFIEGQAGYSAQTNDHTYSGFSWAGRGGVKVAIVKGGLLTFGVMYSQVTLNAEGAKERTGQNILSVATGITVWL